MADVIPFPNKAIEEMDNESICEISINGKGDVRVIAHSYIETKEQYNWLIAKVVYAASLIVFKKDDEAIS